MREYVKVTTDESLRPDRAPAEYRNFEYEGDNRDEPVRLIEFL